MSQKPAKISKIYKSATAISGTFELEGKKYFFKKLSRINFDKESHGYNLLAGYYPVSRLLVSDPVSGLLVFSYEKSLNKNKGLLVDIFANKKTLPKSFFNILELYKNVFAKTITHAKPTGSQIFFEERLNKLRKIFKYLSKYDDMKVLFNGTTLYLHPSKALSSITEYFNNSSDKWCVIAQADPNDLNLGIKPIIFDYTAAGYIPLMAEFASYFWYNLAQGNYLSLKYNPTAFHNHETILKYKDKVRLSKQGLFHAVPALRKSAIREYITMVINPTLSNTKNYHKWFEDFKNYLAMRILTVWDIRTMSKKDQILILSYLEYYYNLIQPKDVFDLIVK